jgi:adenosylcobinamide-GDP ribazoletransferase
MRRAVSFLTPFGGASVPTPGTLDWFPIVGAAIGLAVGGVWWLALRAWPPAAAAAVVVAVDVALTGYLHLDGLADTADGLLPPLDRQRRLEVMADPAVGAFGAVTVFAVLVLRFGAFASAAAAPLVIGALWCGSRTIMAVVARIGAYARPGGLATSFVAPSPASAPAAPPRRHGPALPAAVGAVLAVGLAALGLGWHGVAAVGAEVVGAGAVVALARRRVGGFTGDVLGATGVVGETLGLLVLAAKW